MLAAAILIYAAAMTLANLSIAAFGPAISPINAFVLIGLDLALRDWLHVRLKPLQMLALIAAAGQGVAHHRLPRLDTAERAASGRASCRQCRTPIVKGAWRLTLTFWEDGRFMPASNTKLFTTAAAFATLPGLDRPDTAGGASVLLQKPRSYGEIYNDLDGEVVNLFRVARDCGGNGVAARQRQTSSEPHDVLGNLSEIGNIELRQGQGSGLVSQDHRRAAHCLNRRQMADKRVAPRHALGGHGQRQGNFR